MLSVVLAASVAMCAGGTTSAAPAAESSPASLLRFKTGDGVSYWDSLVLRNDRAAVLAYDRRFSGKGGTQRFRLAAATFNRVRQALRAADFSSLRTSYPSPVEVADVPYYSITHRGKTVTTDEEAIERGRVPRRLTRLIRLVDEIVSSRVTR